MQHENSIITFVKQKLLAAENKDTAQAMAAYMKTNMPFYGVKAEGRRGIVKLVLKTYPIKSQTEYLELIELLWQQSHREEKYIAIDIARAYKQYHNLESLHLYEAMIRQGAWWDFVDDIAIHLVGSVLANHNSATWPIIDQWINDPDMWILRTAIICQNKFKMKTDKDRLFSYCLQCSGEKEFFIRKAIGWALREYAKTAPQEVVEFAQRNRADFSSLSFNEAIRRVKMHGMLG